MSQSTLKLIRLNNFKYQVVGVLPIRSISWGCCTVRLGTCGWWRMCRCSVRSLFSPTIRSFALFSTPRSCSPSPLHPSHPSTACTAEQKSPYHSKKYPRQFTFWPTWLTHHQTAHIQLKRNKLFELSNILLHRCRLFGQGNFNSASAGGEGLVSQGGGG